MTSGLSGGEARTASASVPPSIPPFLEAIARQAAIGLGKVASRAVVTAGKSVVADVKRAARRGGLERRTMKRMERKRNEDFKCRPGSYASRDRRADVDPGEE